MYFIFYIQISCWGGGGWGGISEIHFKKCCYSHLFQKLFCFVSDVTFRCCQHWRSKKWTLSREIRRMSAMNLVIIVKYLYKKMCSTVSKVFFFFFTAGRKLHANPLLTNTCPLLLAPFRYSTLQAAESWSIITWICFSRSTDYCAIRLHNVSVVSWPCWRLHLPDSSPLVHTLRPDDISAVHVLGVPPSHR